MKLSLLQENFSHGLNTVNRFVATRAQLPVLSNILLTTDRGRLKLSATNLETGINLWLGAKIEQAGAISVPARVLAEYVSSLPAEKINLEVKENLLLLSCGNYQANFVGLPAGEFPNVPTLEGEPELSLTAKDFSSAIDQVAYAAAQDEGRPALTGVLLMVKEDDLLLVATDGYRLSLKKLTGLKGLQKVKELTEGLLIPARMLTELGKIISEGSQEKSLSLKITPEANQVIFITPESEIVSRLIEGKFPEFEKILPGKGATRITLDKESFFQAIRATAIFARESANIVKFKVLAPSKSSVEEQSSKLKVSANAAQVGENVSEIEAKVEGEGGSIAFNVRYIIDFLNSIDSSLINFEMSGPLSPGVFAPAEDKTLTHLIMPVRVQE